MRGPTLRDLTDRYRLQEEIGRGSIGIIYRAEDTVLDRRVAVKVLRPELQDHRRHRPRFLREGHLCARLGHPNIVPVFDVGSINVAALQDAPCLVMALLAGRSLRTIIRSGRISAGRQLGWFAQVCNGVAFAHRQQVIHRDIKPAHIFVGDFGQVVLTDWGLAKATRQRAQTDEPQPANRRDVTRVGDVVGTPAYMAPEQAEGRVGDVDHRADIYALGAILYEILTGTRPYEASRSIDVLRALRMGPPEPPRERAPHRDIPPALEAVCLQAMSRNPKDRFDSALDMAANIEAHFDRRTTAPAESAEHHESVDEAEVTATRTEAHTIAAHHLAEGRADSAAFRRHVTEARELAAEMHRRQAGLPYEAGAEQRAEVWRLQRTVHDSYEQAAFHLGQAVEALSLSSGLPEHALESRQSLAHLHRDAWHAADEVGDVVFAAFHRARARTYDDGQLADELEGRATLSVSSRPEGASITLGTYDDRGAVWTTGAQLRVGSTPLSGRTLSAGRLLMRIKTRDGLSARVPLHVRPGESRIVELALPQSRNVPPGFLLVAGGRFLFGGDDGAPGAAPPRDLDISSFCISRQPVTWDEYFEFLGDLIAVGGDATPHLPRTRSGPVVIVEDHEVRWRQGFEVPKSAPVRFVSLADAHAYADWLGRRLGVSIRLPSEEEWEYAAGGVDGRPFPWGSRFVPGLADSRRRGVRGPSSVHDFADDESPFGMRSVAGGVREWTLSEAPEAGRVLLRGGSFRAYPEQCRIGARATCAVDLTHQTIGIRLAADLPGMPSDSEG